MEDSQPKTPSEEIAYMGLGGRTPRDRRRAGPISQHEADLAFVETLLGRVDGTSLDAGTTTLLLWKCRRDPRLVAAAASWFESHSDAKQAFDGVEFYLPQLAHMLIHLDVDWAAGTLERFALVVAQQSPHLALQLHWILRASMEDHAPRADGTGGDEVLYRRCAQLDEDVETVVAHGTARPYELEELFASGKISQDELGQRSKKESMSFASRLVDATLRPMLRAVEGGTEVSLVDPNFVPHRKPSIEGKLKWYRGIGDASSCCGCGSSSYERRNSVFVDARIEGRSLLLYSRTKNTKLVRALPLDGARVVASSVDRGAFAVSPHQTASFSPVVLTAQTETEKHAWISRIKVAASRVRPPPELGQEEIAEDETTVSKSRRYEFFQSERRFAEDLVKVPETLRYMPRETRQHQLAKCLESVAVPRLAYLPLCNSTEKWRTVLSVVSDEGSVFNTKARCPCLVFFETAHEPGLEGLDVANVIHAYITQDSALDGFEESGRDLREEKEEREDQLAVDALPPAFFSENAEAKTEEDESKREALLRTPRRLVSGSKRLILSARKAAISIWRSDRSSAFTDPLVVTTAVSPLQIGGETPRPSSASSTPPPGERSTPGQRSRISDQAERIHERATRVLEFWKEKVGIEEATTTRQRRDSADGSPRNATSFRRASYGEGFKEKERKIKAKSEHVDSSWALRAVIVKSNDDLRQEVFVVQLITRFSDHFSAKNLPLYLRPYRIISLSASAGLVELVADSTSFDKLYSKPDYAGSLKKHFEKAYGEDDFVEARSNFIKSAAASAYVTYALAVKDRHNGNILLDSRGHMVHIDFGFCLGHATGGAFSLERAPFKLTKQMTDLMGKDGFAEFVEAFADALVAARSILDEVSTLIEIMQHKSRFPCFSNQRGKDVVKSFRARHFPHLDDEQLRAKAKRLVSQSVGHSGTYLYDLFQYRTQGIAY